MRTALTKRIVANAQPQSKPYELRDLATRGLILRVQPSGHKAWIVTWAHGKRRTLGAVEYLTLEQARAQAAQAMAEAVQQRLPTLAKAKPNTCTLGAFLTDHYEPWARVELRRGARYAQRIRTHFADLLKRPLHEIDVPTVDRWWRERLSDGQGKQVAKATAYRDLATLRAALSMAVEWKLLQTNALLGMRQKAVESRKIVRFLSPAEEARLRQALTARDRKLIQGRANGNAVRRARQLPALPDLPLDGFGDHLTPVVLLAMNTGLRRGELLSLQWSDVDLEAKVITIQAVNAKNGRQRHLPLNNEALSVMTRWSHQSGGPGAVFEPNDVKKGWNALLDEAGIQAFRFHDLRHDFASKLVRKGVDLNTVRELLGHADIKMTLRYAHLAPDGLAAAVAKLG
ncbi:integrase [Lysobacter niabensis]|uniref:Integrase n=1 Tax=Agrilutibacter niabensis TaxID=380628 RepID=A0ABU1VPB8_9GAMM|nr:site-specific integrase [Lysobacter niabensis]MDR7099170.1 integrase [Lysobacter niabensis]